MTVAFVAYRLDPTSEGVLEVHASRASRLLAGVQDALVQGAKETAAHLQSEYLRGGSPAVKRDGNLPLAARSGALLGSIDGVETGRWQAVVGAIKGTVSRYAKVLLGNESWDIMPKNAKHLWVPIADNLTRSGQMRMTPREAMELTDIRGKRLLRIFKSKAGNLVAFLPEARAASDLGSRQQGFVTTGRRYSRGANKGRQRGQLLFVLKDRVEVKGTDALARAVEDKRERVRMLIQNAANQALQVGQGGGI